MTGRQLWVGLLLLAGCGGSGGAGSRGAAAGRTQAAASPSAAAAPAMACGLIGVAELNRITGLELHPGARTRDYLGYSRCDWDRVAGGRRGIALVVNEQGVFGNYSSVPGALPVRGLGEAAVWNARTGQLGVQTAHGTVSVSLLLSPHQQRWAEEIARIVLSHLSP